MVKLIPAFRILAIPIILAAHVFDLYVNLAKFQGSSGEIYIIKNEDDIQKFLKYQSNSKYIIVIHADVLSIKNIEKLESSKMVAGIVVLIIQGKRPESTI
ncbi:hypothetical protein MXB_1843 [Myxobolus squamalis]|nr:hypothetical protein MXB_1843 [Myxobolus squamalis]